MRRAASISSPARESSAICANWPRASVGGCADREDRLHGDPREQDALRVRQPGRVPKFTDLTRAAKSLLKKSSSNVLLKDTPRQAATQGVTDCRY